MIIASVVMGQTVLGMGASVHLVVVLGGISAVVMLIISTSSCRDGKSILLGRMWSTPQVEIVHPIRHVAFSASANRTVGIIRSAAGVADLTSLPRSSLPNAGLRQFVDRESCWGRKVRVESCGLYREVARSPGPEEVPVVVPWFPVTP